MKKEITRVQELTYELKVGQAMTKNIVIVHPKDCVSKLREILHVNRISGTPVVDKNKLVGIISIEDFIKCLAEGEVNVSVEQKMTSNVETLYSDEPLIHAVNKSNKYGFGRFPVIERSNGKLVGIITKSDIIVT